MTKERCELDVGSVTEAEFTVQWILNRDYWLDKFMVAQEQLLNLNAMLERADIAKSRGLNVIYICGDDDQMGVWVGSKEDMGFKTDDIGE